VSDGDCRACRPDWPPAESFIADCGPARAYLHDDQFFPGWTLLILRRHATELYELDREERGALMEAVTDVARALAAKKPVDEPISRLEELVAEAPDDVPLWQAMVEASARSGRAAEAIELLETGEVTPVIDGTYPLARTREAIARVAAGHARGTVVVTVSQSSSVGHAPENAIRDPLAGPVLA